MHSMKWIIEKHTKNYIQYKSEKKKYFIRAYIQRTNSFQLWIGITIEWKRLIFEKQNQNENKRVQRKRIWNEYLNKCSIFNSKNGYKKQVTNNTDSN